MKVCVLLNDGTTGHLIVNQDVLIGQEIKFIYHDNKDIKIEKTGVVVKIV